MKDEEYVVNINEYKLIETHWLASYTNANKVKYFDSFGAELIPKEILNNIGNKNIKPNIFRIKALFNDV